MEPTSRSRQKSRSQDTELSHASKAQHQAEPESLAPTHAPAPASAPAGLWYAGGPAVGLGAPAAIQPKVAIGPSGDAYEREAESVASQVVAGRNVSSISSLSGGMAQPAEKKEDKKPEQKKDDKKPAQKLAQRAEKKEDKKPEQKKDDKKPAQKLAQRAEKAEEPDLNRKPDSEKILQRADGTAPTAKDREQDGGSRKTPGAAREGDAGASRDMEATATRAIDQKSPGEPLAPQIRQTLEKRMGVNLEEVRVHRDEAAQQATKALGARAFTHGNDIWLGPGESATDMELVAHEVTHVVQQGGGMRQDATEPAAQAPKAPDASRPASAPAPAGPAPAARPAVQKDAAPSASQAKAVRADAINANRSAEADGGVVQMRVDPDPSPPPAPGSPSAQKLANLLILDIPAIKQRHLPLYSSYASAGRLKRIRGNRYTRGNTNQTGVWRNNVHVAESALQSKLNQHNVTLPPNPDGIVSFKVGTNTFSDTKAKLLESLQIPRWDRHGRRPTNGFQVDHIVELQVSGEVGTGVGNSVENMELLDQPSNSSSGPAIGSGIRSKVGEYVATLTPPTTTKDWLDAHEIIFESVRIGSSGSSEAASTYWNKSEIEAAEPAAQASPAPPSNLVGKADEFVLGSGPGGIEIGRFQHGASQLTITPSGQNARKVAGLQLQQITLTAAHSTNNPGANIGSVTAGWDLPSKFQNTSTITIPLISVGPYAGYLGAIPALNGDFEPLSPFAFSNVSIQGNGLYAEGQITPSLPLLQNVRIRAILEGKDITFRTDISSGDLNLTFPGFSIDEALVTLSYGTRAGFGVAGSIFFSVNSLGEGSLTASYSQRGGLALSGQFSFDRRLFDRASAQVWYRNGEFGGEGTIGIDSPDKVRGIRSAELRVGFSSTSFSAEGTVMPSIPGVQRAGLRVQYAEQEGLTIGGNLLLEGVPGIRSGSVDVTVHKQNGEYEVSASGTAEPNIPGINTSLSIAYEAGALTIEGSVQYSRGLASGTITVGATNRPVGEDGVPSGAPTENFTLYGGGELTLKLAPWLQATAGVKLLPNGELEIHGSIALPDALDLFPEKKLDKNLLSVNLDIPIVGVSVLGQNIGIFATIGGGLDLSAGIGPGQLQDLHLDVTYNPSNPDDAHVSGGAKLHVPAQAGLRLFVTGALGAGIPVVSARAGLEVGGQIGLEGALDASLNVDWTPSKGFSVDALGEVSVQPKFKFDITGFVTVEADLLLDTVELYSKRWQLASYEYGSDLKFGVKFPIHYKEGEPFDISLSDVEFVTPDVDPGSVLRGLISEIA